MVVKVRLWSGLNTIRHRSARLRRPIGPLSPTRELVDLPSTTGRGLRGRCDVTGGMCRPPLSKTIRKGLAHGTVARMMLKCMMICVMMTASTRERLQSFELSARWVYFSLISDGGMILSVTVSMKS